MSTVINAIKSGYFQFVNFIQTMPMIWFVTIWIAIFCLSLICLVRFFKEYNGTQKNFVKVSSMVIAVVLILLLVYLTYIR